MSAIASWSARFSQTEFGKMETKWRESTAKHFGDDECSNKDTATSVTTHASEVNSGGVIGIECVADRAPMDTTVIIIF
jgi:hypothetical protein